MNKDSTNSNMENKLLVLSLDSNSYTTLYVDIVESVDEAVKTLLSREANDGEGLSICVSKDGCKTRITFTDGDPKDEYFVVAEAMPMPANRYFVAWWHAYDGVGFDLKGSAESEDDATDMLDSYVENYWKSDFDLDGYTKGQKSLIVDTGNEWEGVEIFDLKEIKEYYNMDEKEAA